MQDTMKEIKDNNKIPLVQYGEFEEDNSMIFYRICPVCGKYVKPNDTSCIPESRKPNAVCKIHGKVTMPFFAWVDDIMNDEYKRINE